jgi:hypothetical protein
MLCFMIKIANQLDLWKFLIRTSRLIWSLLVLDSKSNQSELVSYYCTLIGPREISGDLKEYEPSVCFLIGCGSGCQTLECHMLYSVKRSKYKLS